MQTSKRGLKTGLRRGGWLCWSHRHPGERGCGAPSPAHPAAVTPPSRPAPGTRRSRLFINQGRAGGSQSPPRHGGDARAPASRARNTPQGKEGCACPGRGGSVLTAGVQSHQLLYSRTNPSPLPPSLPCHGELSPEL